MSQTPESTTKRKSLPSWAEEETNKPSPTTSSKPKKSLPTWAEEEGSSQSAPAEASTIKKFSPFEMQKKRKMEEENDDEAESKKTKITLPESLAREFIEFYKRCPRLIVLDCETTGFGKNDQVIELAAIELIGGVRTGKIFTSRINLNDGVTIHEKAQEVHKITEEDLSTKPSTSFILPHFLSFVKGDSTLTTGLVAHNLLFDLRMIKQDVEKYCKVDLPVEFTDKQYQMCTMQLFKKARKNSSYDLDSACHYFGIDRKLRDEFGHTAKGDTELTAELLLGLKEFVQWDSSFAIAASPKVPQPVSDAKQTPEKSSTMNEGNRFLQFLGNLFWY